MIAWYPSQQAWRAVTAAVPLMATARRVEIVSVGEDEAAVAKSAPTSSATSAGTGSRPRRARSNHSRAASATRCFTRRAKPGSACW